MWEYARERAGFVRDQVGLAMIVFGIVTWSLAYRASTAWMTPYALSFWVAVGATFLLEAGMQRRSRDPLALRQLRLARAEYNQDWAEAELRWAALSARPDGYDSLGRRQYPSDMDERLDPGLPFVHEVPWPRQPDGRQVVVPRIPVGAIYLLVTLAVLALFGTRALLSHIDTRTGFGPDQAPAVVATAVGLPGLVTLVIAAVPRIIRAWGAKSKDAGEGDASGATGRAAVIRAEKEGEAAILLARAELRRADAEYLRAQKGLDPLPPASSADGPPASSNGTELGEVSPQPQA
ncbi:hypothetical protein [Streptomyces sp. NPDC088847]|uniref:hypothetical protein n=1 Tax=Streptomyces sp. NPDC088847 TaxID=3365909 RepID=UPI0037FD9331